MQITTLLSVVNWEDLTKDHKNIIYVGDKNSRQEIHQCIMGHIKYYDMSNKFLLWQLVYDDVFTLIKKGQSVTVTGPDAIIFACFYYITRFINLGKLKKFGKDRIIEHIEFLTGKKISSEQKKYLDTY